MFFASPLLQSRSPRSGQSFLALVFLIGGMIAVIGVMIALFASSFVDSGSGYQASALAEAAVTSGAEDALLQLDRNPSFSSSGYSVVIGSTTATVSVTQNSPSINFVSVSSTATVSNHTRKLSVVTAKNSSTSQISVISWQEIQ